MDEIVGYKKAGRTPSNRYAAKWKRQGNRRLPGKDILNTIPGKPRKAHHHLGNSQSTARYEAAL